MKKWKYGEESFLGAAGGSVAAGVLSFCLAMICVIYPISYPPLGFSFLWFGCVLSVLLISLKTLRGGVCWACGRILKPGQAVVQDLRSLPRNAFGLPTFCRSCAIVETLQNPDVKWYCGR
jgi:hypothetical protein